MNAKKGSEHVHSSSKQIVRNGLKTSSSSNIASHNSSVLVRERTKVRASSAKYYDIASTILGGSTDVEELFLNSAKNGNCKRLEQLLQQSSEIGLNINCVDKRTGNTALIWASKRGNTKVVELLLRHGADATLCNYETQTALETAFLPVKTIILDWIDAQEVLNERLLLQAAWQGNLSVVRKVLQNKNNINVNCHNPEGLTPLILVCRDMQLFERLSSQLNRLYNPIQVAEELMKGKANIHVTDSNGRSCLHYASQSHAGSAEGLTVALVSGGLDMELCDKHLLTPLHVAAQSGNTGSLVALVDRGSDVNVKGFAGLTPLHMTAFNDHHATALTLLKYGADVTITDDHGLTPFDVAKTRKMKHTLKDAAKKGSNPSTDDAVNINTKSGIDENAYNNNLKAQTQSQNAKSKVLSNVDRCKQGERKILQEVEALKAHPLVLQRETTRMLGTTRTKILPQIGRSKSPEHCSKISPADMDSKLPLSRRSDGLHKSLEESRNKLNSEENSILDIGIGKRAIRSKPSDLILSRDLPATLADIRKDSHLREKGSLHQREDLGSPSEILRSHSILKEEFILEESRPKEIFSSSDPTSSVSSGSLSSSSPRDLSFPQPSPTRSVRHDPILSTLLEQRVSTHFLVSDSAAGNEGKPLIMKPHKKLRRRSDNSLCSSLESDIDELRTDKAVTRSNSLKKSSDEASSANQEPTILIRTLTVFKSQSMESISPKVQSEASFPLLAPKTGAAKSNSVGNLDSIQTDHLQTTNSDPCQSTSSKKPAKCEAIQNPAKCIKPSKKLIIEPFIGKTRVLSKTRVDSCKNASSDSSMKKSGNISQRQEQKSYSDEQLKSITRNEKDSLAATADAVRRQATMSAQVLHSEGMSVTLSGENLVTLNGENSIIKTSSVTKNVSIHSSPTSLNPRVSKPTSLNTSVTSHEPATQQSGGMEHFKDNSEKHLFNPDEPNRLEGVNKQKCKINMLLQQLKIKGRDCDKKETKQHLIVGTVGDGCKGKSDNKPVHFKIQKNMQSEKSVTCVSDSPSTHSCDSTESVSRVGKSNIKSVTFTSAEPPEQSIPPGVCKETNSTPVSCIEETGHKQPHASKNQDSVPVQPVPKCGHNNPESVILPLNNHIYSFATKPNIQLNSTSTDPLIIARFHETTAKLNMGAATRETNAVISTPVIVNPFEEFLQPHARVFENSTNDVLMKVKKPSCSKILNKNIKKATPSSKKRPNTSMLRQTSAGKKQGAKTKDLTDKESRPKSGRKSGKGQRCKKTEKTIENETHSETAKPNIAIVSGVGWQLSTSRASKSKIEVSTDLHLYSSDSDFSLDLDENENSPHEIDYIKEEMLNRQPFHAFSEQDIHSSPRSVELEHQQTSSLHTKHSVAESDDIPPMKQDINVDIHKHFEQADKTSKHNNIDNKEPCLSTDFPSQDSSVSSVEEVLFNVLSPIPEISSLSKPTNSVSDVETNCKKITLLTGDTPEYTENSKKQISENTIVTNNTTEEPIHSEHQNNSSMVNENIEDKVNIKYEYTSAGKIVRSQSFKDYHTDRRKSERTVSETHSQKNGAGKTCDRSEDIDEIIEEILSSTTSSMTSTMRNVKSHETGFHMPGTHSLSESDRNLLLKMSHSVFASPFHATASLTSKMCSSDASHNLLDTTFSKLSSSDTEDNINSSSPTPPLLTDRRPSPDSVVTSVSNKPPPSVRSSLKEEGTSKSVLLGRSSSSREHRRHHMDPKSSTKMTDVGAKQLVKILSNFKHMGLQASANCIERSGGSAKCLSRNVRKRIECSDHKCMTPPVLASASFRSKGRFQEIKDNAEIRISLEVTGALQSGIHKQGQQSIDEYQTNTVGSERSSVIDIKCDEGDTIQWKKGNVLGRGAFGTVWCGLTSEGQLIAVKHIELTTMDKSKAEHEYEQVQEEVELLKTLEHVNIVSYLGTSLEDNIVSIFMQFIPGGSIANILARFGALEESVFRHYTKQILEGVRYLHDNDVIHRDIKGANVMLMPNGVIKLIDFGCAKKLCINMSISQTELLKSMNGTPFWMAPEVVNESGHGKKSDIWSIGCTVFEMATRKPPWADMNPMAAIFAIGSSSRPVPVLGSRFSHDARDFVSQCMTRDQDGRPGALELQEHPFITKQTSKRPSRSDD